MVLILCVLSVFFIFKLKLGVLIFIKIFGGFCLKWVRSCFLIFKMVGRWERILISFIIDKVFILKRLWKFVFIMFGLLIFFIIVFGYWCFNFVIILVVSMLLEGFLVIMLIWIGVDIISE